MITQNIIGFDLSSSSGRKIYAKNPVSHQVLEPGFSVATPDEVNLAMEKAVKAWRVYRNVSGREKAPFLRLIADGIEALGDELMQTISSETGYPESRIMTERNRTCAQLRMFADLTSADQWKELTIDEALPDRVPAPRPELRRVLFPIGPVVVFGASNFPLAYSTMGGDAVAALAVGCPVIIKAHESHLGTNALVAEVVMNAARQCRLPDGVFSSLIGDGLETGKQLVLHPHTAAVGFTGSFHGGKALFDLAATRENPIPVFAEMGSVNPIFILPGMIGKQPQELIAKIAASITLSGGQFCTKPGIIVVLKGDATSNFIHDLAGTLEKTVPVSLLNENIASNFQVGITGIRQNDGATLVLDKNEEGQPAVPALALTTADQFLLHPRLHSEIFGPYALVVECDKPDTMMAIGRHLEGQLTSSVFFREDEVVPAQALIDILLEKAGRIICNGVPTGVEVCAAMTHGGPFPATTDSRFTAVGQYAIRRWLRPVTIQNAAENVLPPSFQHG